MKKFHLIMTILLTLLLVSCAAETKTTVNGNQPSPSTTQPTTDPDQPDQPDVDKEKPTPPPNSYGKWIAVGDVMMHSTQLPAYFNKANNTYNFDSYFTKIKPILAKGNWTLGNLETPLSMNRADYSGYPVFNAPAELAGTLKRSGFSIATTANNHALDRGGPGIIHTLEALEKAGLVTKGTARTQEEANKITIVEKNGIKMGLLAYSFSTNGFAIPKNMPFALSMMDETKMIADIKMLKSQGVDFITVAIHFGTEYQPTPNETQIRIARHLVAAGADIIAGSHPHVIQPFETVNVQEKDGTTRKALIIYSMGNFISNMSILTTPYGLLMDVDLEKNYTTGKTTITKVTPVISWVHKYLQGGVKKYEVYAVPDILANKYRVAITASERTALEQTYKQLQTRVLSMSSQTVTVPATE